MCGWRGWRSPCPRSRSPSFPRPFPLGVEWGGALGLRHAAAHAVGGAVTPISCLLPAPRHSSPSPFLPPSLFLSRAAPRRGAVFRRRRGSRPRAARAASRRPPQWKTAGGPVSCVPSWCVLAPRVRFFPSRVFPTSTSTPLGEYTSFSCLPPPVPISNGLLFSIRFRTIVARAGPALSVVLFFITSRPKVKKKMKVVGARAAPALSQHSSLALLFVFL